MTWFLASLAVLGTVAVGSKKRWGWLVWMVSNAGLLIYFASQKDYAFVTLYSFFFLTSVRGWWLWRK